MIVRITGEGGCCFIMLTALIFLQEGGNSLKISKRFVALFLCALLLCLSGCQKGETAAQHEAVAAGVAYLQSLEALDPDKVRALKRQAEEERKQRQKEEAAEKLREEREEQERKLRSGEVDVWSQFKDYVILGDSRAVGFYYYDFLDKSRVLADGGNTIATVPERLEAMHALDPRMIFLCYGINDTSIGYWNTKEEYVEAMGETLNLLQKEFPEATVVVSSILPARDPAFRLTSKWYQIPDYSNAVKAYCEENHIAFADNTKIAEEHADLWQPDGIHLCPDFYPYWATNLIIASWGEIPVE